MKSPVQEPSAAARTDHRFAAQRADPVSVRLALWPLFVQLQIHISPAPVVLQLRRCRTGHRIPVRAVDLAECGLTGGYPGIAQPQLAAVLGLAQLMAEDPQ
ncbi:hypothetical protein AB3466_07005 [Sphingobacterium thalpophilum]|uniref:hypothetical protein n=1 Tax=Sphingobacterium thalpophilum TaxID=259 RepID=UPI002D7991DF|nr:hypothetical protein [Sphingobacterium thalpophilum]